MARFLHRVDGESIVVDFDTGTIPAIDGMSTPTREKIKKL